MYKYYKNAIIIAVSYLSSKQWCFAKGTGTRKVLIMAQFSCFLSTVLILFLKKLFAIPCLRFSLILYLIN